VKRRLSAVAVLALVASALILTACPPRESIAAINRDPGRYAGREFPWAGALSNPSARSGLASSRLMTDRERFGSTARILARPQRLEGRRGGPY